MTSRISLLAAALLSLALVACDGDGTSTRQIEAPPPPALDATAFEQAQDAYLDQLVEDGKGGSYGGLGHLARGIAPVEGSFEDDLRQLNSREDTADFALPGLLQILYNQRDSAGLDAELLERIETGVINFKFWPDELENVPGTTDVKNMVFWTENHYILFASGAYLAGQLYPDTLFPASGNTGREQVEIFRPRIMKWLELRYRSGFSEWLSNVYYNEDMPALLALIDLADDEEIVEKSKIVLDMMFADLALNSFEGTFGSTHGRTYGQKRTGRRDSTGPAVHLAFDLARRGTGNMTATMLALSERYRVPEVLYRIANDTEQAEMENRQRMSIKLEEAQQWGLSLDRLEDGMSFLTLEPYAHPLFIDLFYEMLTAYEWWDHRDFKPFNDNRAILDNPESRAAAAAAFEWDITRNMRPEVNIYTYRTPSYMLSTAQDWRKGFGGDQSSIWQATLDVDAVTFTTHPATEDPESATPNYWVGYGTLPRAAQVKNVVISLYDVDTRDGLYYSNQPLYTHAYLPRAYFDSTEKDGHWFFARKDEAYLALWSSDAQADWVTNDDAGTAEGQDYEIIANGEKTIWIVELGDADQYGDFASFKSTIKSAGLTWDVEALQVEYTSPAQGQIHMGWEGDVLHNGSPVQLEGYGRYQNPWIDAVFPGEAMRFEHGDAWLELDFDNATRRASELRD